MTADFRRHKLSLRIATSDGNVPTHKDDLQNLWAWPPPPPLFGTIGHKQANVKQTARDQGSQQGRAPANSSSFPHFYRASLTQPMPAVGNVQTTPSK